MREEGRSRRNRRHRGGAEFLPRCGDSGADRGRDAVQPRGQHGRERDRRGARGTRRILAGAPARLDEGGLLVVEIGHNREALEAAYPTLPFTWLDTAAGDEYVFLLHAADLLYLFVPGFHQQLSLSLGPLHPHRDLQTFFQTNKHRFPDIVQTAILNKESFRRNKIETKD